MSSFSCTNTHPSYDENGHFLAPASLFGVIDIRRRTLTQLEIHQAAAYAGGLATALAVGVGTGVVGTGVILYGAYRGANHACKQMVSRVDDGDGEDSKSESSDSENDENTSIDRGNELPDGKCECAEEKPVYTLLPGPHVVKCVMVEHVRAGCTLHMLEANVNICA